MLRPATATARPTASFQQFQDGRRRSRSRVRFISLGYGRGPGKVGQGRTGSVMLRPCGDAPASGAAGLNRSRTEKNLLPGAMQQSIGLVGGVAMQKQRSFIFASVRLSPFLLQELGFCLHFESQGPGCYAFAGYQACLSLSSHEDEACTRTEADLLYVGECGSRLGGIEHGPTRNGIPFAFEASTDRWAGPSVRKPFRFLPSSAAVT